MDHTSIVVGASLREGLSRLFTMDVDILCESPALQLADAVFDAGALLLTEHGVDEPRAFHGMVTRAEYLAERDRQHLYRFRLEPLITTLAYRVRSRIFQELSVVDIIKTVLRDVGLPDDAFEWRVGTYETRPYTVQYRESELAFVLRLLEHDGI